MKKYFETTSSLVLMALLLGCQSPTGKKQSDFGSPPVAEKIEKEMVMHEHSRIDNYYWLNERENQNVIDYLNAENDYLKTVMASTEPFQEKLYEEIIGRIKQNDESVPYLQNGYYYYTKYLKGGEYPVYCRKKGSLEAQEEVMLNVNEMASGFDYYAVSGASVSPDNKLLAFGVDTVSRRKYTLYVKNLESGEIYNDAIPETTGRAAWANDNKTFFFTRKNPVTLRSETIFRHKLGTEAQDDEVVYHEQDETFSVGVSRSKSGRYLFIGSSSTLSSEYRILDANLPDGDFAVFQQRERGLEYSIDHHGEHFYITTNWDAENFKLMKTATDATSKENWETIIEHREDVLLRGLVLFDNYLVITEVERALPRIRIFNQTSNEEHYLPFDEEVYSASPSVNREFKTNLLRFSYTSLTTPGSTFDYNMETGEKTLLKQDEVVGQFDPADYTTERRWAKAADGTDIPMSIVYRKGTELDGANPALLYAYGSYGSSMSPRFSSVRLSLLDRGFVYALAHIRGGQEMGRYWYEEGKLFNKINTFSDFNDCAEYLIKEKYTTSEKLFAKGGSAGGLLMGAILNMRPDLYRGVIANVPFVDVVTTMLDETIPLTTSEYDEWGNPNQKEYYDYMLSYSPYDNVEAKDYPALLVTTGLHDSQVQYFEPAKWVAKLRELKTDDNILLLSTNMEAGHGGASGRFKRFKEDALEYAFVFDLLGITE